MSTLNNDNTVLINEWLTLNSKLTAESRSVLQIIATEKASDLAQVFYSYMLGDEEAALYLSVEQIKARLSGSMANWIKQVLTRHGDELHAVAERQQQIGSIHARIGIPVPLVLRGMRKLKAALSALIQQRIADVGQRFQMQNYVVMAIDLTSEMMTHAYALLNQTETKNEESYRLQSLISNVEVDRGKQQAALFNWENSLIYALVTGATQLQSYLLKDSEFGVWFRHKCARHFTQKPVINQINRIINEVDRLLTANNNGEALSLEYIQHTLRDVRLKTIQINNILSTLFEEASRLKSGKDALINLLNRRFLPTVMKHEIRMAMQTQKPLVMAMVEAGKNNAETVLEHVRMKIAQSPCELREEPLQMSLSIGFTLHDGHPDYEKLLQ